MRRQIWCLGTFLVMVHAAVAAESEGCAPGGAGNSYVLRDAAALHQAPQATAPISGSLKGGDRFTSSCRVKGSAGEWWLKVEEAGGPDGYVLESATEKAGGTAKAETQPPKPSRDPLLQGRY